MELTVTEASKTFKISRQTIHKKISNGKLSKLPNGRIDFSELLRVFGEPQSRLTSKQLTHSDTNLQVDLRLENAVLQERVKNLEESLRDQKEFLRKAEKREESLTHQVEKLMDTIKLLDAPKVEPKYEDKQSFFTRLFG